MKVDTVSTDFITGILRNARLIDGGVRVVSLTVAGMREPGLLGDVERVRLTYDPPNASGPLSLIVKAPAVESEYSREMAIVEANFYRHGIAAMCGIRVPVVYDCALDEETGESRLILEDLGDRGSIRLIDGCGRDEAVSAIRAIAGLHARWYGSPLPPHLNWICPTPASPAGLFCKHWLLSYRGDWPEALGSAPRVLCERFDVIAGRLEGGAPTVVHGDFHCGNISFGKGAPAFVDFQLVQHASGMLDVAKFLATSLQVDVRRSIEGELLDEYGSSLRARGATDYEFARHLDELRAALLWNLAMPLALHVRRVTTQGHPWPHQFPILERCLAAIDDWHALEIV